MSLVVVEGSDMLNCRVSSAVVCERMIPACARVLSTDDRFVTMMTMDDAHHHYYYAERLPLQEMMGNSCTIYLVFDQTRNQEIAWEVTMILFVLITLSACCMAWNRHALLQNHKP